MARKGSKGKAEGVVTVAGMPVVEVPGMDPDVVAIVDATGILDFPPIVAPQTSYARTWPVDPRVLESVARDPDYAKTFVTEADAQEEESVAEGESVTSAAGGKVYERPATERDHMDAIHQARVDHFWQDSAGETVTAHRDPSDAWTTTILPDTEGPWTVSADGTSVSNGDVTVRRDLDEVDVGPVADMHAIGRDPSTVRADLVARTLADPLAALEVWRSVQSGKVKIAEWSGRTLASVTGNPIGMVAPMANEGEYHARYVNEVETGTLDGCVAWAAERAKGEGWTILATNG